MIKKIHDYAIQAAWKGANDRQYSIEFGSEHRHLWMLREMARSIDPSVDNGLGTNGQFDDMNRPSCFVFKSKALTEVFAESASSLPARLLSFLRGTA
jgi:hypothetical protein